MSHKQNGRRKVGRRLVSDRRHRPWTPMVFAGICLAVGVVGLIGADWLQPVFDVVNLDAHTFFARFLLSCVTLFALLAGLVAADIWRPRRGPPVLLAAALALATATLLSAEAWPPGSVEEVFSEEVDNWSTVTYLLFTRHRALLLTGAFVVIASVLAAYYIIRGVLRVRFEGTGIQIRLPGQTVYQVPIFPQATWQNTDIHLTRGDQVSVEISGLVSPGALQAMSRLEEQRYCFHKVMSKQISAEEYEAEFSDIVWPYTGPEGYDPQRYHEPNMYPALRRDPLYRRKDYYKKDPCLTIRGLPHNFVVGIIREPGHPEPRSATLTEPGYDYAKPEVQDQLICLSSGRYPIRFEAPRTGELWVVINDVDEVRWDNTGLFFLKLVQHT